MAEDKPISAVLKQLIQALCAEEVGFISVPFQKISLVFSAHYGWVPLSYCWSEAAAGPSAEGEARGRDDRWWIRCPDQPVLSSWQCGWGAQPEEGNVSEAGALWVIFNNEGSSFCVSETHLFITCRCFFFNHLLYKTVHQADILEFRSEINFDMYKLIICCLCICFLEVGRTPPQLWIPVNTSLWSRPSPRMAGSRVSYRLSTFLQLPSWNESQNIVSKVSYLIWIILPDDYLSYKQLSQWK